jgi:hypothetical protein
MVFGSNRGRSNQNESRGSVRERLTPNTDLIPPDLRGNKRPVFRQLFVDEFHFSAVVKCFAHSSFAMFGAPEAMPL